MLAWPAIFGVIAVIAVQMIYGKPGPDDSALRTSSVYLFAYNTGAICAAVFVALILTWIVYRLAGRSRLASHATFFALTGFFCLSIFSKYIRDNSHRGASQEATSAYPTFGIALAPPANWMPVRPDRDGMVASWISPESSPANPSRMIVVVLEIPEAEKLADRARRLADDWGGKVVNEGISLDGEVAWRVQRNAAPVFQPVEAIITGHHEQFYLIYGSASGSNSCHEEMEVIRTSWKWTSIDTPAHHLEFRSQPITTFNGKVSLNFPAVANTFKTDNPQRTFGLSITNIIEKSFDFDAVMKLGEFSTGDTLEAACERVGTGTQKLHGLSESFVWRAVRGSRESVMTQPLLVPSPNRPFYVLLAIARLDGNQFVLVNFSIFTRDPGERSEYVVAAQRIVESIAINNPPSQ